MSITNLKYNESTISHAAHAVKQGRRFPGKPVPIGRKPGSISDDTPAANPSGQAASGPQAIVSNTVIDRKDRAKPQAKAKSTVAARAESYLARGIFGLVVMKL